MPAKTAPLVPSMDEARPLSLVLRAWDPVPDQADRLAQTLLNQAQAGYRYARTGEGRILLTPLEGSDPKPVQLKRGSGLSGRTMTVVAMGVAEMGGEAILVTSELPAKGNEIPTARALLEQGLRQVALQVGRSGRIYPLRLGEPRRGDGKVQAELTARVLIDGESGLP